MSFILALTLAAALAAEPADAPPASILAAAAAAGQPSSDDWTVRRVGGNLEIEVVERDGSFFAGTRRVTTPLPVGYPRPTPPGAIELKKYPTVRRADVSGESTMQRGTAQGFWPLFRHIESRDIAMTAPVEIEMRQPDPESPELGDGWRMSFFYRSPDLGPTGDAENGVTVIDTEPVTVLSLGVPGRVRENAAEEALEVLYDWLGENVDQWRRAGQPRILGYNAPMEPRAWQWTEVQIPVQPVRPVPSAQQNGADPNGQPDTAPN